MALGLVLLAASALYSGYSSMQASGNEAKLLQVQGETSQADYEHQAYLALDEGYRLRQTQAMQYIGGGVELQGTPLLMLAETKRRTEVEAGWIRRTGRNTNIITQEKANITKGEGRSAFISSIFSAAGTYALGSK